MPENEAMKTKKSRLITVWLFAVLGFIYSTVLVYADSSSVDAVSRVMSPIPGKAVVIVYREKKLKMSAADYKNYLNDVPLAL